MLALLRVAFSLPHLFPCNSLPCLGLSTSVCLFLSIHTAGLKASLWLDSILAILCQWFPILIIKFCFGPWLYCHCQFPHSTPSWVMSIVFPIYLFHIFASWYPFVARKHNSSFSLFICSHVRSLSISQTVFFPHLPPSDRAQVILHTLSWSHNHKTTVTQITPSPTSHWPPWSP